MRVLSSRNERPKPFFDCEQVVEQQVALFGPAVAIVSSTELHQTLILNFVSEPIARHGRNVHKLVWRGSLKQEADSRIFSRWFCSIRWNEWETQI